MSREHIDTPIAAVTVYPDAARVTRRRTVTLPPGEHRVTVGPLPLGLQRDSLRVGGHGPATVLGVDVRTHHQPHTTDPTVTSLERQRREVDAELTGLTDADAVDDQRAAFLGQLAERAGASYARSLAGGTAAPTDVAAFADALSEQLLATRARQRQRGHQRDELRDRLAAIDRQLAALTGKRAPDQLAAEITLLVTGPSGGAPSGEPTGGPAQGRAGDLTEGAASASTGGGAQVELELSYVVPGAGWQSSYDIRLVEQRLTLTWYALIKQRTGEDWPEVELALSTARPSVTAAVPELDPWYLDRIRPLPLPPPPAPAGFGGAPGAPMQFPMGQPRAMAAVGASAVPKPVVEMTATVEQGVAAATYRPARPVAVPADGSAHRATVAVLELPVRLDHVTAPVRATEAHLRATVTNSSAHTLLPGPASVFHGADFVGTTRLPIWAPGEETELALGVDDRVRVERELVRRGDTRATLGSTRRREVGYEIRVANHTPRTARVSVLDQLPVSRDEQITVRELRLEPAPESRSELGELIWRLELPPGGSGRIQLGWRVDMAKGVELSGWRE